MLEKKRMNEIVNLVDEFIALANDAAGIAEAKVYSTRPLTEEESACNFNCICKESWQTVIAN